jgi:DNA-binding response OmpR family regulator
MAIVLLSQDLMVVSQVSGAAAQRGATVRTVSNTSDAAKACSADEVELMIVDLGTPSVDVVRLVDEVKSFTSNKLRIVAFGPHVHVDKLDAAKAAGCDVMSRGQFLMHVGSVLTD